MCGIVYSKDKDKVGSRVKNLFDLQKGRGTDGFGVLEILDDEILKHKKLKVSRFIYEQDAIDYLEKSEANEILFHHRIPTSTRNSVKTNHPIIASNHVYKHDYYLVHNGIISNCEKLKEEHEKLGIKYSTIEGDKFNDSESLLHELALIIEGYKETSDIIGSLAFIMLQTEKETNVLQNLFFGRNSNPLSLFELSDSMTIRSVGSEDIKQNRLFNYDYKTGRITYKEMPFSKFWFNRSEEKMDSKRYMLLVSDVYEGKKVGYNDLLELNKEELNIMLVIARKVLRKMELSNELSILKNGDSAYTFDKLNMESIIDNIQSRLKYAE